MLTSKTPAASLLSRKFVSLFRFNQDCSICEPQGASRGFRKATESFSESTTQNTSAWPLTVGWRR